MKRAIWFGIVVVLVGVLLLLNALGVTLLPEGISLWGLIWPTLLLGLGVDCATRNNGARVFGILLALVGLYFLLVNLYAIDRLPNGVIFPVIVIAIGLSIVFRPKVQHQTYDATNVNPCPPPHGDGSAANSAPIDGTLFSGTKMDTVFSSMKLDLTTFQSFTDGAAIDVSVVFGGCEIIAPSYVRIDTTKLDCVFGGCDVKGIAPVNPTATLRLTGSCVFGGTTIIYR